MVLHGEDALHMLRIERSLHDAYEYILEEFMSDNRAAKLHFDFVRWMIEGGTTQYYGISMWASTNRDLLREWVLNYIIEQEWA